MSQLADHLQTLAAGQSIKELPDECDCREQLLELIRHLDELKRFVSAISAGDLTATLQVKGALAGNLKALHANLRHLTWQTQQVAAGDFSQRVDFLGAFSEAFNSMVTSLATARDELTERNRQLADTCEELKMTQSQLLQQEKMASIGQLAAGVAHEINNPIGFVKSNLGCLGRYGEKLAAYFAASEPLLASVPPELQEQLAQLHKKYSIKIILEDLPDLIKESSEGTERVRKIVQDLKNFSRVDRAEFEAADLNAGLESTLSIVWSELKYKATIEKEFGELPPVWCNMGQLNQVFVNLLINASQAIAQQGTISVSTRAVGDEVRITIRDTGCGMAPEIVSRIFEPFFTTKDVGKGTGLGLSIVYDIIVNKHQGAIDVSSEPGVGTEFAITLPVKAQSPV
jgi:two-component system, NtrC family, sensor kinase